MEMRAIMERVGKVMKADNGVGRWEGGLGWMETREERRRGGGWC